jgi:hypothetical protein
VQLFFKLYIHTGTYSWVSCSSSISSYTYIHTGTFSWVSWCSSISSYTYIQELTLGYPGAALFQAIHTHRNLLSGILVQVYFKEYIPTGTLSKNYSQVSQCSSISS